MKMHLTICETYVVEKDYRKRIIGFENLFAKLVIGITSPNVKQNMKY